MTSLKKTPFLFTLFGASGDLAKLKIFPSFFALALSGRLPDDFLLVGYARSKKTRAEFQKEFADSIRSAFQNENSKIAFCEKKLALLLERVHYFSGQYTLLKDFEEYSEFLDFTVKKEKMNMPKTNICYFSVPPKVFAPILENIALARQSKKDDIRIVLEKPFGEDEQSAKNLFHLISRFYEEKQVFLLDHYLGKTAVQSILHLRHNNAILNMLLKGREIAQIQITAHETLGIEERAGYFDEVGIIKDMFQSHLTQILAMVTMSIPITADATSFHREKQAILHALDFSPREENIFVGQYEGYRDIPGVAKTSVTETYFAAKLKIDRESWYGVPIFVRTGKRTARKNTTVVVEFKKMRFQKKMEANHLIFELQPREMIHIKLLNQYGQSSEFHEIATSESIACRGDDCLPEHALLLLDVLKNEKLHFLSFPEVIASWRLTDCILGFLRRNRIVPTPYSNDDICPKGAKKVFKRETEKWFEME